MKLNREEKAKVKSFIQFEDGVISNQETLEKDLIKFCNKKYREKYKEPEHEDDEKNRKFINIFKTNMMIDGEEVEFKDRAVMEDNEYLERTSVILYQESIKNRKSRGIRTKNDSKNIEPISSHDIGQKRQYDPYYQLHGEKVYLSFESSDDYSETSTVQFQIGNVYARDYNEREHAADEAINKIFDKYRKSENKNEILYRILVNLNKYQLDYFSQEALVFFLQQELKNYNILDNQQKVLERILLCGDVPDANQKKILKRLLRIPKKKQ